MKQLKIAFYGKGGIGKSTIATNVSAMLAKRGLRVLHIGCDPKADSTRLLTEKKIPTVLQQFDKMDKVKRENLVFDGKYGVQCVEAGGPEAGCGCAGLGIMTAIDELQQLDVFEEPWDAIIYDVLGDVVCGGFSVPMRNRYVDMVFVVTSPSYMSIYAANNILKGIGHYCCVDKALCGGIIGNHVHSAFETEVLMNFSKLVNVPLVAMLEEDDSIQKADYQRCLFAIEGNNNNTCVLENFVEQLLGNYKAVCPSPLDNDEIENFGINIGCSI